MKKNDSRNILVAVPTYQRNKELHSLLDSLATQVTDEDFTVLVIDNSEDGQAELVAQRSDLSVSYVWEPSPGIVSARNRALSETKPHQHKAIAFIDDDEIATRKWLQKLVDAMYEYNADVVTGPVVAHLPKSAPSWMSRGGFHQRKRHKTGKSMKVAATNNVLIDVDLIARLGYPTFDPSFNFTGGEDSDFFSRLAANGAKIFWCDEAVVEEEVPEDRLTVRWIWTRIYWGGIVAGQLELRDSGRFHVFASAFGRIGAGCLKVLFSLVFGRGVQMEDVKLVPQGIGRIAGLLGIRRETYARQATVH